jgi:hypothetical protein
MADQLREAQKQQQLQQIQIALQGGTPRFYANSVAVAQTASDIPLVLMANGSAVAVVNVSYITAKSLLADLQQTLTSFERATKSKIKTINEIAAEIEQSIQAQDA